MNADGTGGAAAFAVVEARGVGKVFGRERALAQVDLRLEAGDSVALLGPNGAGKSTLVSILSTMMRPSSGEVRFDGKAAEKHHRAGIGLIAHDALCYGDLSARENLHFFSSIHGVRDAAGESARLLERVGLTHAADRAVRTFSRGMLQRLSVARALLHAPRLLLCDEPFTGLDRQGQSMLVELLNEQRAAGAIVFVVSHDLEPLPLMVSRALVLRRGRLAHDGPAPGDAEGFRRLYREHVEVTVDAPRTEKAKAPAPVVTNSAARA